MKKAIPIVFGRTGMTLARLPNNQLNTQLNVSGILL